MVKKHLKRIAMPKTWQIKRKGITFITRPNPGAHKLAEGMPLNVVLKNILNLDTTKETKSIIYSKDVFVDGIPRVDHKHMTGMFDVISFPKIKQHYRITLNKNAKLDFIEITEKESLLKPVIVKNKTLLKGGKFQLNVSGGRNILLDKNNYKTGDTLMISLPKQEVKDHFPMEKGNFIFLLGGKHAGTMGTIKSIEDNRIIMTSEKKDIETLKRHAFVVGKKKPAIKIQEE